MSLAEALEAMQLSEDVLRQQGMKMMQAAEGKLFKLDFLALAAINRTLNLSPAFTQAVTANNFLVAGSLIRLHLDTCLRFYAASLVENPHSYAMAIWDGTPTYKLKTSSGEKMTDTFLVGKLSTIYPWMKAVYEHCSGYIHLSKLHVDPLFTFDGLTPEQVKDHRVNIVVGHAKKQIPEEDYVNSVTGFNDITQALGEMIVQWRYAKESGTV